jgi:tyrosine-specific transport protein
MQTKNSSFGAIALITGCCVGAGMLGLPLVTMSSGFILSIIPLFIGWAYMYLSGLMVLEVYLDAKQNINLMGLLDKILGKSAKIIGAALFLFLFYSILTAYLNASSILIQGACNQLFKIDLPQSFYLICNGFVLFTIILFTTRKIDLINRFLVFCMLFFYVCLIYIGSLQVDPVNLKTFSHPTQIVWSIPVFILSFGFQNLVPTVSHYLNYDAKRIKSTLFKGTFAAFIIYLIWNFIILGVISNQDQGIVEKGTHTLHQLFDSSSAQVSFFIKGFSFFAIITSVLAVSLSFVNFISDSAENQKKHAFYTACVIVPPVIFSLLNPDLFLTMLHIAGGIGAVSLFGLLPPFMIWKKRYVLKQEYQTIFPFAKLGTILYIFVSIGLIVLEIFNLIL